MVDWRGSAALRIWGATRALAAAGDHKLTGTGLAIGTPQYMSPEQSTGDTNVDGRSDLYALACLNGVASSAAGRDLSRPGPGRSALADRYADEAMSALRRAVDAGYTEAETVRTDPALFVLRRRPEFRLLLLDMTFPAHPFAR